jgi:hypothetical protein
VTALPVHVVVEAYSVLTRLPSGLAVPAATAAAVLSRRFADPPLGLDDETRLGLLERFAAASVFGDSSYDGLVALEAAAHGCTLLTLDERARTTYARLGVPFRVVS